jgi:mono/diheme cytochrome c family protein
MTAPRPGPAARGRAAPAPLDSPAEARSLDRHYVVGLVCMALLIVAFPLYKRGEPARRAATREAMLEANVTLGRDLFAQHCAACHGDQARGGRGFPTLAAREFLESVSDRQLHWLVSGGVPGSAMVAYDLDLGGPFTAQEITRVVAYLRSLEPGAPSVPGWFTGAPAPPRVMAAVGSGGPGTASRPASTADAPDTAAPAPAGSDPLAAIALAGVSRREAERAYQSSCMACHGPAGEGTPLAPAIRPLRGALADRPDSAYAIIARGVAGTAMMAFAKEHGGLLEATMVRALVVYLRTADPPP